MEKFKFALKWYNQTYKGLAAAEVRKAAHMPLNMQQLDQEQPEMPAKLTIQEALKMMKQEGRNDAAHYHAKGF